VEALYRIEGDQVLTGPLAAGPWDPTVQHGAAPASLVAWAAEQVPLERPMQVSRITIDLMRPVPVGPLEMKTEILRQGRKIQLIAIRLFAGAVEVVRASVLKVRVAEFKHSETAREEPFDLPAPESGRRPESSAKNHSGFLGRVSARQVKGDLAKPGPAAAWFSIESPIIDGVPTSALMRAAMAADFCNGVSAVVDFERWTFINADSTLSLIRMPIGDWILVDARTRAGASGAGIACARLADRQGYFACAAQTILLEPRRELR